MEITGEDNALCLHALADLYSKESERLSRMIASPEGPDKDAVKSLKEKLEKVNNLIRRWKK